MTPPIINEDDDQFDDAVFDILSATSDDGYIELILKMLSLMCDGQHNGIQVRIAECSIEFMELILFLIGLSNFQANMLKTSKMCTNFVYSIILR